MSPFDALNERYAITAVGNKMIVMELEPGTGNIVELWPFEEFKKRLCKQKIKKTTASGDTKIVPLAKEWLESKEGNAYDRLVYAMPGSLATAGPHDYNGWRGFAVEPRPGDWSKNRAHVRDIICNADDQLFAWVINWMAALAQHPGLHASAAIVLRSGQGTGKGHFADKMLGALFHRQQYIHLMGANQLTAEFNEHLSGKVLVFADEATWGGDPKAAGRLKGLVTENTVIIRRLYLKAVEEPSALHIIIASNSEWPIPADWDDRRFLVLDVNETRKQDESYFAPLVRELEQGGLAAMLHDLLNHVVDYAALRHPPDTAAKADIKAQSLNPMERWLTDWLMDDMGDWREEQPRHLVHASYAEAIKPDRPRSVDALGKFLRRIFKRAKIGGGWPLLKKMKFGSKRVNAWVFPQLEDFRKAVDLAFGTQTDWVTGDVHHPTPLLDDGHKDGQDDASF
jgi:hypothetical protein